VRRGRNASTTPNPRLTSNALDTTSSWVLAPTGCFTYSSTTELVEIGAPVIELSSTPPLQASHCVIPHGRLAVVAFEPWNHDLPINSCFSC
jgi:hypothetical protein